MMDIQSKIAARRAEVAQQQVDRRNLQDAVEARHRQDQQKQTEAALDQIADDISVQGVVVKRDGEELAFVPEPLPPIDVVGIKRSKIATLLKREARRRWTPSENWQVIGLLVGGTCLIHLAGFGLVLIVIGFGRQAAINKKHRTAVRAAYPELSIAAYGAAISILQPDEGTDPLHTATLWQKLWWKPG